MRTIFVLAGLLPALISAQGPKPPPLALPAKAINFIGRTKAPPGPWVVDTNDSRDIAKQTYYYRCGEPTTEQFNPDACSGLMNANSCDDMDANPFVDGADVGNICKSAGNTALTAWRAPGNSEKLKPRALSDACGWLGARCEGYWLGAISIVIPGDDVRRLNNPNVDGFSVNVDNVSIGAVKIKKK